MCDTAKIASDIRAHLTTPPDADIDVTAWIRSTMSPDIAAWALVLTPGARWHIAPGNLVGRTAAFAQLRALIQKWDTDKFLVEQFDLNPEWLKGDPTMKDAYADALAKVADHELAIDTKITEFGA